MRQMLDKLSKPSDKKLPQKKEDSSELFIQAAVRRGFDYDPDIGYQNSLRNEAKPIAEAEATADGLRALIPSDKKLSVTIVKSSSQADKFRVLIQSSHRDRLNEVQIEILKRLPASQFEQCLIDNKLKFTKVNDTTIQANLNSHSKIDDETFKVYSEAFKKDTRVSDALKIKYDKSKDDISISLTKPWQTLRLERILTPTTAPSATQEDTELEIIDTDNLSPLEEIMFQKGAAKLKDRPIVFETDGSTTLQCEFPTTRRLESDIIGPYKKAYESDAKLKEIFDFNVVYGEDNTVIKITLKKDEEPDKQALNKLLALSQKIEMPAHSPPPHSDKKMTEQMRSFIEATGKMGFVKGAPLFVKGTFPSKETTEKATIKSKETYENQAAAKKAIKDKCLQTLLNDALKNERDKDKLSLTTVPVPRAKGQYKIAIVSKNHEPTAEMESILAEKSADNPAPATYR